jgi:hypothetical protein
VSKTIGNEPLLLKWSFCEVEGEVVNDWVNPYFREKITAITGFGRFFREN